MTAHRTAPPSELDAACEIADAVLFEGYMLYPYRANDTKNRVRWQFGVLAPPRYTDLDPSERSTLRSDILIEGSQAAVTIRVRFLQVQQREVQQAAGNRYLPVDELDVGPATYLPWDEATVHDLTIQPSGADSTEQLQVPGGIEIEELFGAGHEIVGRLVRTRQPVTASLRTTVEELPGPYGVRRLTIELTNTTEWLATDQSASAQRPDALRSSLVAAHLLVSVADGVAISQLDPPEWAKGYVADCVNVGAFPVLAGPLGARDLVLASPIILYDHPQVAPESAMSFCDATEMDEMLTLRTMTLTDQEKRQVRGSDPRAAELMDQLDDMPPELLGRLHGAIRSMSSLPRPVTDAGTDTRPVGAVGAPMSADEPPWWDPGTDASVSPETDSLTIAGAQVHAGTKVRLRPGARRADAQDMFLADRIATVTAVFFDVDGGNYLAVTLDDLVGPDDEFINPHGRFLYFQPDEVTPIGLDS